MEHQTKKKRVYLTSRSYLRRVKRVLLAILGLSLIANAVVILMLGITFTSLGVVAGIGVISMLIVRYFWSKARSVSLKSGNLILKSMNNQNVVAPMGSLRAVNTRSFMGYELTQIRYRIDGSGASFFIITKPRQKTPEKIIKEQIEVSRKRKKEANHKPDSVLTQIA